MPTDTELALVPKISVMVQVYEGKKPVANRYQERQKSVLNWYLRCLSSGNSILVPNIICSSLTTSFIRTTSLPYNFFG
ncbi:hypothetical protein Hanom_Chr03g00203111 [Helianthus anomalus]